LHWDIDVSPYLLILVDHHHRLPRSLRSSTQIHHIAFHKPHRRNLQPFQCSTLSMLLLILPFSILDTRILEHINVRPQPRKERASRKRIEVVHERVDLSTLSAAEGDENELGAAGRGGLAALLVVFVGSGALTFAITGFVQTKSHIGVIRSTLELKQLRGEYLRHLPFSVALCVILGATCGFAFGKGYIPR
jgi:hypothetical protein